MSSFTSVDTPGDYYAFLPGKENWAVKLAAHPRMQHRLGTFSAIGRGARSPNKGEPSDILPVQYPRVGVLHVPEFDMQARDPKRFVEIPEGAIFTETGKVLVSNTGSFKDDTAVAVADYIAVAPGNKPGSPYAYVVNGRTIIVQSSIHLTADRERFVTILPADTECYGCGNQNTRKVSFEIEISGWGPSPLRKGLPESAWAQDGPYWRTEDGLKKLRNAAKGYYRSLRLAFGGQWKTTIIPFKKAVLAEDGSMIESGWTQHREVPFWDYRKRRWAAPPYENLAAGQHGDIAEDFPWDLWFSVLAEELNRVSA